MAKKSTKGPAGVAISNRKARYNYAILETLEAGIVLTGSEVKSLRQGKASISEAYATVQGGEAFLLGMHIPPYAQAGYSQHEPLRPRKLLLHKEEIQRLIGKTAEKGLTLVPLSCYFKNGFAKIELGLARGKKLYDKRESIKEKEWKRQVEREFRTRGKRGQ
jgi:SsrA-binding protein